MVISKLAYGDLARTMEGCNQGNWLLRIGFMCLLKYFWRVWKCGGPWIWGDWKLKCGKMGCLSKQEIPYE